MDRISWSSREYLRWGGGGGGSECSNHPEIFWFFLRSEGKEVERKKEKKMKIVFWGWYFFEWGWDIFRGVEKFSDGGLRNFRSGVLRNFREGGFRNFCGGGGLRFLRERLRMSAVIHYLLFLYKKKNIFTIFFLQNILQNAPICTI